MEGQATRQQVGERVHLLEVTILFRQAFKPYANFLFDEYLLFRGGKEMERGTQSSLFDDPSSRQEIETGQ